MNVQIREVRGRRGLREFVRVPFELYRDSAMWVPPLIGDTIKMLDAQANPGFEHWRGRFWVAEKGGRLAGRVAGFVDSRSKERRARFGYLDLVDDREVASSLLGTVEKWFQAEGRTMMEGPFGLTTFEPSAVLVEGFEELPTAASTYNYPYYGSHLEACGYEKEVDYLEFHIRLEPEPNPRVEKIAKYILKKKGLRLVRAEGREDLLKYAGEVFGLINETYSDLHGFVPLTDGQIRFLTKKYFPFLDPAFIPMVADADGRIVAVAIGMPSLSRGLQAARGRLFPFGFLRMTRAVKSGNGVDMLLIGVKPELQKAGVNAAVMHEMHKAAIKRGRLEVETNGELETNEAVLAQWDGYDARQHKRRRVYRKRIG